MVEKNSEKTDQDVFVIYGGTSCQVCKILLTKLKDKNIPFKFHNIQADGIHPSTVKKLIQAEISGVPIIFYKGTLISNVKFFNYLDKLEKQP